MTDGATDDLADRQSARPASSSSTWQAAVAAQEALMVEAARKRGEDWSAEA